MWFTYNDGILGSWEDWHTPACSSTPSSWEQQWWCNVCSNRNRCTAQHNRADCQPGRGERRVPKVWNLGGGELLGGRRRGGTVPKRVACGELGRDLEEGGETGHGEGAVSQPHLQRFN